MTQCRDVENSHHEHLSDIALQMLEKFVKNQLTEDLHDELRIVREYACPQVTILEYCLLMPFSKLHTYSNIQ